MYGVALFWLNLSLAFCVLIEEVCGSLLPLSLLSRAVPIPREAGWLLLGKYRYEREKNEENKKKRDRN
jgi:hypothetical protein